MRWYLLALAACGRLDFDERVAAEDAPGDAMPSDAFRTLCAFEKVTLIGNGIAEDQAVATQVQSSLQTGCVNTPFIRAVSQDDAGILAADGRPLLPADELAIIGGGDGPNRAIRYLEASDTPVLVVGDPDVTISERATGRQLVQTTITSSHDIVVVMVIRESIGGGRVLSAQGLARNGTTAAGLWFARQIAPSILTDETQWAVVEWNDTDLTAGPDAGDTFTLIDRR